MGKFFTSNLRLDLDEARNEKLIEKFNKVLTKSGDVLYILGNLALSRYDSSNEYEHNAIRVLNRINGIKVLVPSRNDIVLMSLIQKGEIQSTLIIEPDIKYISLDTHNFVLCHYPLTLWEGRDRGTCMLHGHFPLKSEQIIYVGLESSREEPISIEEVQRLLHLQTIPF